MARTLQVGALRVSPGEKQRGAIETFRLPTGQSVCSPCTVVSGQRTGSTLYIGAGTHGDEFNSIEIARNIAESLDPAEIRGNVIVVPMHNVPAVVAGQRLTPFDGMNLDTSFPGDPHGSASSRIAHALFTQAIVKADLVVDMHTASAGGKNLPFMYVPPATPRASRRAEALALQAGLPLLVVPPRARGLENRAGANLSHALFAVAGREGIPSILMELGEARRIEPDMVSIGRAAVRNIMIAMGILPGRVKRPARTIVVEETAAVRAEASGVLLLRVRPGQRVRRGDLLATIHGLDGEASEVRSPHHGMVIRVMVYGMASPGDRIAVIGITSK